MSLTVFIVVGRKGPMSLKVRHGKVIRLVFEKVERLRRDNKE